MDLEYNIGKIPLSDNKWEVGIGYISIPSDFPRDQFISECFLKGTVSFKTMEGGHYYNCPINKNAFNDISFPQRWQDNGTPIVYVTEPVHQQPIVVGALCFNDEIIDQKEHQFKLKKIIDESLVEIIGSADDGCLTLFVGGKQRSDLYIRLENEANASWMNIDIDGQYLLTAVKDVITQSQTQVIIKVGETSDKSTTFTQNNSEINMRVNKFSVNDGSQAMLLGNKWKEFIDALIDEISRTTVTTSLGQMPILNAAQVAAFKQKTEAILSEISFTD